jgi:transcriptional regulator with XRE-family HTH domain
MNVARAHASDRSPRVLTDAVVRASRILGLAQRDVAQVLGTSEASVSRLSRGRRIDPATKEGELAVLLVRVFRSLDALVGGDEARARAWLHADNAHLGGIPADRIRSITGLVDVAGYLDALRGKS